MHEQYLPTTYNNIPTKEKTEAFDPLESITIIFSAVIKRFMQSKERFSIECRQTETKVTK